MSKMLTQRETAEMIGVQVQTLRNWRLESPTRLPYVANGPRTTRYRLEDVEKYLKERTLGTEAR